jgi:DNA-binding transcriptional MerR regulator
MYAIGEFSRISGLTIKTLRFYHEAGLIVPAHVDEQSGYRYYSSGQIETARVVTALRGLELPVAEIAEILRLAEDDGDLASRLEEHRTVIAERLRQYQGIARSLDQILKQQREMRMNAQTIEQQVIEKSVPGMLIAGIRHRGRYRDCGELFGRIARSFGRYLCGPAMMLHYDCEFKEDDADFEACFPIKQAKQVAGIDVRELPAQRCVALVHQGPYDLLGESYTLVFDYIHKHCQEHKHGQAPQLPTREVYLKGPGMILKGNPKKYLTEIQIPID